MPQVGSEQRINEHGHREQELWWQWWQRDRKPPEVPFMITGVKISPGDRVLCSLSVMDPSKYVRINVCNRTTGTFATVQLKGPIPAAGQTSEWVVERQSDFLISKNFLYAVPDFGEVMIDHCVVENHAPAEPLQPWTPRYIQLTQHLKKENRVVVLSQPTMHEDERKVRLRYRRPMLASHHASKPAPRAGSKPARRAASKPAPRPA